MKTHYLHQNFEGYLRTPLLWNNNALYGLKQCFLSDYVFCDFNEKVPENLRLGQLVERFVMHQIKYSTPPLRLLAANITIIDNKRTVGEIDALLMSENGPIHLEIAYKFYLYDPDFGNDELSHWIGPNRKDNLIQKLNKLKNRQLPLLYHSETQKVLDDLNLIPNDIEQLVLFKAQLFVPIDYQNDIFFKLNPKCVKGFYIKPDDLQQFKAFQFYIPEKTDWLMDVDENVKWINYDDFVINIKKWLDKHIAPLCWLNKNGVFSKFFVIWW